MNALPEQPAAPGGGGEPRGRLASNIVHFARTLRSAGLRVGPGQVLRAIEAVEAAGVAKRDDFYWTLHSVFVNRRDQREIFDQAFHVYWRNPRLLEKMMEMLLPSISVPAEEDKKQISRRLQDALQPGKGEAPKEEGEPPEVEVEATFTVSDREVLQQKDFEQMRRRRSTRPCGRYRGCACRCRSVARGATGRRGAVRGSTSAPRCAGRSAPKG